MNKRKQNHQ